MGTRSVFRSLRLTAFVGSFLALASCAKNEPVEGKPGETKPRETKSAHEVLTGPSASAFAQALNAAIEAAKDGGVNAARHAGGPELLVTNEDSGDVAVIDLARGEVTTKIAVGKRPRGIRMSPDGKLFFVALSGSAKGGPNVDESKLPPGDRAADGIGVVDTAQWKLVRVLKSGQDPEHFDVSRDGKTIFVSNEETGEASSVDVASGEVTGHVKVGDEPEGVTLHPSGTIVYVTSEVGNQIAAVDVASRKVVATIETGPRPRSVVFTQDGKKAFAACETGAQVTVIDAVSHRRKGTLKVDAPGARPMGTALSPDGKSVYVTNGRGGSVSIIDVASEKITGTIANVGTRPWGIVVSADGTTLYTANGPSNDVSVIDVATKAVVKRIAAGQSPWGVALTKP